MIRAAIFLTLVAVAFGAPRPSSDLGDFPPHPGCHYNITPQANFKLPNGAFHWYFDTISSSSPVDDFTCLDWNGNFTRMNGNVGKTFFAEKVVKAGQTVHVSCHGPNYADANADFATKCLYQNKYKFNIQLRVAETDYKSYALLTSCAGPDPHGNYFEAFGILAAKKTGVDPAVRQRIVKRVVAAGWNPAWIRRIPSQKDC